MLIHPYTHGTLHVARSYYGHGFGSIFARLFSKIAAKTASRAAMSAAKRVGSKLVRTGIKKVIPIAKKTLKSAVRTGIKKATPVAKRLVKKGVKRAAEKASDVIASKVQKVENYAIKKGVPRDVAHSVSSVVADGSRQGISTLSKLTGNNNVRVIKKSGRKSKSIGKISHRSKSRVKKKKSKRRVAYQIQNLIDSA